MNKIILAVVVVAVGVAGYFAFVKESPQVAQQTNTPTPTKTAQATKSPTASPAATSKTYTNNQYGYEFKYPAEVKLSSVTDFGSDSPITNTSSTVYARAGTSSDVIFSVRTQTGTLTTNWIKQQFGATNPDQINPIQTNIASKSGYKLAKNSIIVSDWYFVQNGNTILSFTVSGAVADQILSTFKFTQ